ncbi:hypothetical protein MKX01_009351, partial [Papaver californicum]
SGSFGRVSVVELPQIGAAVTKISVFGAVESVKATLDIKSPVSGEIVEDTSSTDTPGLIGVDGIHMLDPNNNRTLRIYMLETITRSEVLELLGFQICVYSCLEYLGAAAVQWVVLKTDQGYEGRLVGKSLVLKFLRGQEQDNPLGDMNSTNKTILSSCQSCLNSLLNLFREAIKKQSSSHWVFEVDNLLWLLDILEDRQAAEEFALMWANQKNLANLHNKVYLPTRHLVSCITTRLFAGIQNGKIFLKKDTRKLLLQTWFQPLVDDYPKLKDLKSFDPRKLEEDIEVGILELHQKKLN